jgi:hypothetical protein
MNARAAKYQASPVSVQCPYCKEHTPIEPLSSYAPVYVYCSFCMKKFVIEPVVDGIQVFTMEKVPYSSDPDSRCIERAQGDEE